MKRTALQVEELVPCKAGCLLLLSILSLPPRCLPQTAGMPLKLQQPEHAPLAAAFCPQAPLCCWPCSSCHLDDPALRPGRLYLPLGDAQLQHAILILHGAVDRENTH